MSVRDATWAAMFTAFVDGQASLPALAMRHGVNVHAVRARASSEEWGTIRALKTGTLLRVHPGANRDPRPRWTVWRALLLRHYACAAKEPPTYLAPYLSPAWAIAPDVLAARPDAVVLPFRAPPPQPRDLGAPAVVVDLAAVRARRLVEADPLLAEYLTPRGGA